jgi:cation:H+ antiporter
MDIPDLSGGNIFGANMYNMLLLAFVSLLGWRERALRKVRRRHGLTAGGSVFMILLATFFIYANIDIKIGWVGIDSIIIIITYLVLVYLLRVSTVVPGEAVSEEPDDSTPKLWKGLLGFSIASAVLVAVMPWMVRVADDIAELSGLSEGFIGVALMAFVTTMPELVATIAAVRMRVYDLAIGNLFGSNMFNIFALGLVDILFTKGRFLNTISPEFILVGFIGMIMTLIALIGNQARLKRRLFFVELDATALVVTFILGMILIYNRGLGM